MTQNQMKQAVAAALIQHAGTLVEFWGQAGNPDIPVEFARDCIARWLKDLPGDTWDARLGDV